MANTVTLLGAEEVSSAANRMRSAAEEMSRAAASIDMTLHAHRNFLEDWLARFEQVLRDDREQRNG